MTYKIPTFKDANSYIKAVMSIPMLDENETPSKDRLITTHLKLVVSYALQYKNTPYFEDIVQEGNLALIKAAENYDPECGFTFGTFASKSIRFAVMNSFIEERSIIKTLTTKPIRKAYFNLPKYLGDSGKMTREIADRMSSELDISVEDVYEAFLRSKISYEPILLDNSDDEDDIVREFSADECYEPMFQYMEGEQLKFANLTVTNALNVVNEREASVLQMRYLNEEPNTLKEVGETLKVSTERARQIEVAAIKKIRKSLDIHV